LATNTLLHRVTLFTRASRRARPYCAYAKNALAARSPST
jgi:hypothetical protein